MLDLIMIPKEEGDYFYDAKSIYEFIERLRER
jgi:hypothetical protein